MELLKVHNAINIVCDIHQGTIMVLVHHLSAAFDIVDHKVLLCILHELSDYLRYYT